MKNFLSKYIGDKAFYKMVLAVAIPILLQNGITNFVSLLDNIMVGQLGTEQMSGVAIVNQLIFIFNLACFGAVSGAGIFTAQFHGKLDDEGIQHTVRFKIIITTIIAIIGCLIFGLLNKPLISLYLSESSQEGDLAATLAYGKDYIYLMLIGLLPFALSQVYSSTLRETEHAFFPMIAGSIAVVVNIIGNYILIFGKLGCPALGVKGAAIATVVSRYVELAILIIYTHSHKEKFPFMKGVYKKLFEIDPMLFKQIIKKGMPLMLNEILWSIGISLLAQSYSMRGIAVVAGYNIASTVWNCFSIAYMALGLSVGIIVGKYLGADDQEGALDVDRKMIAFSIFVGICMGAILAGTAKLFPQIYNTSDEAKNIATYIMYVLAIFMPFESFLNACYFTIRSGGKTIITFIYDSGFVTCVSVPLAQILVRCTSLPIIPLVAIVTSVDLVKCLIGSIMLKKRIWLNKIV